VSFLPLFGTVMMWPAQRVPVIRVPELLVIAAMRDDMVDHNGGRHPAMAFAEDAEWMLCEVGRARLLPCRRVAALTRGAATRVELASLLGSLSIANRTMKRRSGGRAFAASEVVRCVSESSNLQDCEMTFVCAGLRSSTLNGGERALPFCPPHFRGQQIVSGGRGHIALLARQSTGDNNREEGRLSQITSGSD
jgi:hypothetical protein